MENMDKTGVGDKTGIGVQTSKQTKTSSYFIGGKIKSEFYIR